MGAKGWIAALVVAMATFCGAQQKRSDMPDHLVIGVDSFFDFGPPFSYYDILTLDAVPGGVRVERAQMSEPSDMCSQTADFKVEEVVIEQSMVELLGGRNVCAIPEKELTGKRKDCKHCLVFSGQHIVLEAECSGKTRLIRTEVLDRDIYDSRTRTPVNTAWARTVLEKIDAKLGKKLVAKPMFPVAESTSSNGADLEDDLTKMIALGRFDDFFGGGAGRPSELLRRSFLKSVHPDILLESATPLLPTSYVMPAYPAIAKAAHISGKIEIAATINREGKAEGMNRISGPELFEKATVAAIQTWQFPVSDDRVSERLVLNFDNHCVVAKP